MNTWDELVGQLANIPDLPGARCRGRSELFDQTIIGVHGVNDTENLDYARNAALRLCAQCPALDPCRAWFAALRPTQRPVGVIAGQPHTRKAAGDTTHRPRPTDRPIESACPNTIRRRHLHRRRVPRRRPRSSRPMGCPVLVRRAAAVKASATDVARAARLVAAVSASDDSGAGAILDEARQQNGLLGLAIAIAVRHVQVAGEYYDTDRQQILDMYAMDALTYAEESE